MTSSSKKRKKQRQLALRIRDRLVAYLEERSSYFRRRKFDTDWELNPDYWHELKARTDGNGMAAVRVRDLAPGGADPVADMVREARALLAFDDLYDGNWPDRFNDDVRCDLETARYELDKIVELVAGDRE